MSLLVLEVLMGVPAAGKSTWAAANAAGRVLSADGVRLVDEDGGEMMALLQGRARRLLGSGDSVTVDACSTQAARRAAWLAVAAAAGAATRLVVFEVPPAVAHHRNAARPRGERVPWPALQRYVRTWPQAVAQARSEPWGEIVPGVLAPITSGVL